MTFLYLKFSLNVNIDSFSDTDSRFMLIILKTLFLLPGVSSNIKLDLTWLKLLYGFKNVINMEMAWDTIAISSFWYLKVFKQMYFGFVFDLSYIFPARRIQDIYFSQIESSHPEVFLGKAVLKICSEFTGKPLCRSVTSIKSQNNLIEITLWHVCSPVNFLHIFRTPFLKNISGGLLL